MTAQPLRTFFPHGPLSARPAWARYGFALVMTALGWLGREALTPAIGPTALPFIFFFPTIVVAAWYGGPGPGAVSTLLAAVIAGWALIDPVHAFSLPNVFDIAALAAFLVSAAFIVAAVSVMHRARQGLVRELERGLRAEAELAESRDLFATTLASIGDGVIATDAHGNVSFMNPEAERLTGWSSGDATGQALGTVFRIVNEHSRQPSENPVEKVFRQGTVVGLANHTLLLAKDGSEVPVDDSAAPIRHQDGSTVGAILVFRDVREQRQSQYAQARLAAIVEHSTDAIISKSLDGTIRTWNAGAQRLFGYRAEEIVGKSVMILIPPERAEEETLILSRLHRGEAVAPIQTVRLTKDGHRLPVLLGVSPVKDADGQVVGASKILHDISDIVAAGQAVERERERFATTLASIGDGVIVTDDAGRVTFLNPEAERLTGWSLAEARGQELPLVFRIVNEETGRPAEDPVQKVLRHGHVVGLANHTALVARDGNQRPIDDSAAPIKTTEGAIFGVVLVFRDITERRQVEQVVREADRRKDEFLAMLSHELRNPLAPIQLAVTMLRNIGPREPKLDELRDIIDRQTKQLARLLDDLLDVSRITSGKIVLRKARVSVSLAIERAVEVSRPVIEGLGHNLDLTLPAEPMEVEGDLNRLAQVISNLLNNAAKYSDKGDPIHLSAEKEGAEVVIRVRDTGIGLSADQLSRIFVMFSQVNSSIDRGPGGLGVGLALSRQLVELHGGRIEARSAGLGKGSEFVVRLPALVDRPAPTAATRAPALGVHRQYRILVADDNKDSALLLALALRHAGHEVRTAHDGEAAVDSAASFLPEVAFLDIGMPKLNGYEAARRIRAALGNRVVLVAVTGWGQAEHQRLASEAGFDRHLIKPVDFATLEEFLGRLGR